MVALRTAGIRPGQPAAEQRTHCPAEFPRCDTRYPAKRLLLRLLLLLTIRLDSILDRC